MLHAILRVIGKTTTWGMPSDWYMKWCMDGQFYERYSNAEITQEWGHDGKTTWYADIAGRVLKLGMDEAEVLRFQNIIHRIVFLKRGCGMENEEK